MLNLFQSAILLITIFATIFAISYYYTKFLNKKILYDKSEKNNEKKELTKNYMGFIFIVFGLLKLYDLPKFMRIFSKYDIISKNFKLYGLSYPFIEIIIGILFLSNKYFININIITIILMIISIVSVVYSMMNGEQLRCGCLGSFFHIPLSYITISENVIMLIMALQLLTI